MLRINEAIGYANANGKRIRKIDLARLLWPDSSRFSQNINMNNLCSGKTKTISPEFVEIICRKTGVDPNFLYNIDTETI
jgi:hypothetical protein